jgi:hypothetical protein
MVDHVNKIDDRKCYVLKRLLYGMSSLSQTKSFPKRILIFIFASALGFTLIINLVYLTLQFDNGGRFGAEGTLASIGQIFVYVFLLLAIHNYKWRLTIPWFVLLFLTVVFSVFLIVENWEVQAILVWAVMIWFVYVLSRDIDRSDRVYLLFSIAIVSQLWDIPRALIINISRYAIAYGLTFGWFVIPPEYPNAIILSAVLLAIILHRIHWRPTKTNITTLVSYAVFYLVCVFYPSVYIIPEVELFIRLPTVVFLITFIFSGLRTRR